MESTRKALRIPGDGRVSVDVQLIPARQVGKQGTPPVVRLRCATDKGVQSIDLPADSTGHQPAVDGQQPTLTAAEKITGPQPAVDGQQPALTAEKGPNSEVRGRRGGQH